MDDEVFFWREVGITGHLGIVIAQVLFPAGHGHDGIIPWMFRSACSSTMVQTVVRSCNTDYL